jgi:spermidine synthase
VNVYFTEEWVKGFMIGVKIDKVVFTKRTKYQHLAIYDTPQLGRILTLDNVIQTTEKYEYLYHESIVHVPLFSHQNPEDVLIIGGGDGGTLREVLKHPEVKRAVMVDIDGDVVEASKQYLPLWNTGFSDPRAQVLIQDGIKFVAETDEKFDVVLVDSTDPEGPGLVLFTPEFYKNIAKILKPGGIMCAQTESPLATPEMVREIYQRIAKVFPVAKLFVAPVPSYPGSLWSFTCGSFDADPATPVRQPGDSWNLKHYSPEIHRSMFVLSPKIKQDIGITY